MKTKLATLKFLIVLCCAFATTAAFGATIVWSGGGATPAIGDTNNWVGLVLPNSANGDVCQWDSTVAGNLFITSTTANGNFNNGTPGVSFYIAAGHTGSWNLSALNSSGTANIALNATTIDSGAGAVSLGDSSGNVLNIIQRPSSSSGPPTAPIHTNLNNSAYAATIFPNVRYQSGGGNPHQIQFDGTGNWIVSNALNNANGGNNNDFIIKRGSGTMFWNPNSITAAAGVNGIGSPIDIEGGTLDLTASGTELNTQRITNNATFQFDGGSASQTLSGPFDGAGNLVVSSGTLTLSSSLSDWTGNIVLTNTGVLIVGGVQNIGGTGPLGTNGTIFFYGGTLQFSAADTFDYSPWFSTANNQLYSIDTGGQTVTLTNALTSSGGTFTKLDSGKLTISGANTYSGLTTVSGGVLEIQGSQGSGNITVNNSTTLGVTEAGPQITPGTLTVGTSASATLEFNSVSSTTTPAIAATTVSNPAGSPITVNITGGSFSIGSSYPLISFTGTPPAVTLGSLVGAVGNLSTNGSVIQLNVTSLAFVWNGLNNGNWDTNTTGNWKVNGVSQIFANGGAAVFDDTATGQTNVILNSAVSPAGVTVSGSTNIYSIASSGGGTNITGTGGLTKNGTTKLTLSGGVNTYSGATTISGGILSVGKLANGGSPSDIGAANNTAASLVLNGGTLQLNATVGTATSDHLFTLGLANGTIDDESASSLTLNNTGLIVMNGTGVRNLTLTGNGSDVLNATLSDNGGATSLAKSGSGTWVLGGNNTNSGTVTITAGTLQVGNGGASGSLGSGNIIDNGGLDFNTSGTLTNGTITGTGSVTNDGSGTVILPGNNTYSGVTAINAGTLQIGNGGASGSLNNADTVVDNGTFIYNATSTLTLNPVISGTGNIIVRKGTLQAIGNNTYTGWTEIDPGATFQPSLGNVGLLASSVVTNNGSLLLSRQDNTVFIYSGNVVGTGSVTKICNNGNEGDVTFTGQNTYTGGTYIIGGDVIFGDNEYPLDGAFVGNVFLTNDYVHASFSTYVLAKLILNRADNFTNSGNIIGDGSVTQEGYNVTTLTGIDTWTNGTTISAGILQAGNGGTTGFIGSVGPVTDNAELDFNRSDSVTFGAAITGSGTLVQLGTGTLTLTASNSYTGTTTVSNGMLVVSGGYVGYDLDVYNGSKVAPAPVGSVGTLVVGNNLNFNSGTALVTLNKSLAQSNSIFAVVGTATGTGGTLILTNYGPTLVVGDKFYIFTNAVVSGGSMTLVTPGFTVTNNLAVDGSVTVTSVVATPTSVPITATYSGGVLNLSWPSGSGTHLQAETNSLTVGVNNSWVNVGGVSGNSYSTTPNKANGAVFYRLSQ